jgi:four helix bundle protein
MKINSYKDLEAYKKAYEVAKMVYRMTATFPKEELYGLTNQLRRAAVSVPSNIAEGYMRGSKEYVQYLKIALGSAAELETQLSLSRDLGFCDDNNFNDLYALNEEVIRLLKTYIKRIGHSV